MACGRRLPDPRQPTNAGSTAKEMRLWICGSGREQDCRPGRLSRQPATRHRAFERGAWKRRRSQGHRAGAGDRGAGVEARGLEGQMTTAAFAIRIERVLDLNQYGHLGTAAAWAFTSPEEPLAYERNHQNRD